METKFRTGDRVVDSRGQIGVVKSISRNTADIEVDYGTYTGRYDRLGCLKGGGVYDVNYIELLTPEKEKELLGLQLIQRCIRKFKDAVRKEKITPEMASEIIKVLEVGDET